MGKHSKSSGGRETFGPHKEKFMLTHLFSSLGIIEWGYSKSHCILKERRFQPSRLRKGYDPCPVVSPCESKDMKESIKHKGPRLNSPSSPDK